MRRPTIAQVLRALELRMDGATTEQLQEIRSAFMRYGATYPKKYMDKVEALLEARGA